VSFQSEAITALQGATIANGYTAHVFIRFLTLGTCTEKKSGIWMVVCAWWALVCAAHVYWIATMLVGLLVTLYIQTELSSSILPISVCLWTFEIGVTLWQCVAACFLILGFTNGSCTVELTRVFLALMTNFGAHKIKTFLLLCPELG
jgi:hypothetical protein